MFLEIWIGLTLVAVSIILIMLSSYNFERNIKLSNSLLGLAILVLTTAFGFWTAGISVTLFIVGIAAIIGVFLHYIEKYNSRGTG